VLGRDASAGFALNKNWAPRRRFRVGNPTNTGKSKVYAQLRPGFLREIPAGRSHPRVRRRSGRRSRDNFSLSR